HGPAEPDQQQRDQEVGRRPEPVGKMQSEQDDRAHHQADACGVAERPREAQATGVEQTALAGRQRRHGGQVVGLERMTETQQQAEAREGEQVGRGAHGGPESSLFSHEELPFLFGYNLLGLCPIERGTWSSPLPGWRHCAEIRTSGRWGTRRLPTRRSPPPVTAAPSSACTGPTWRGCTAWCGGWWVRITPTTSRRTCSFARGPSSRRSGARRRS